MDYDYYHGGDAALLAALAGFTLILLLFAVASYVVMGIFLMKLLKNAGHRIPVSAWVPLWNTVSLMEIGGIKQPWIWTAILFGGSLIGSAIPFVGPIITLGIYILAVILTIYLAKGVQGALGLNSVGGIILAVLVPVVWVVWMAVRSDKNSFDREVALAQGGAMPMNWFGESDRHAPFDWIEPSYQPTGYAQSQPDFHSGYPAKEYPAPGYTEPTYPEAPVAPAQQPTTSAEPTEPTPSAPPRFSASPPPRGREESEDEDGNRIS